MATMTDLAKDAFMNRNYLLACEIFEKLLKEKEEIFSVRVSDDLSESETGRRLSANTLDIHFGYADSLAKSGKLKEALDAFAHVSRQLHYGMIPLDKLKHLTNSIVDNAISKRTNNTSSHSNSSDNIVDSLCCPICVDILRFPVTSTCGHTFCRQCCFGHTQCTVCGQKFPTFTTLSTSSSSNTLSSMSSTSTLSSLADDLEYDSGGVIGFEQDILIRRLVERWWGPELKAAELNEEAHRFLDSNSLDDALRCCNQSLEHAPNSFKGLLLRSEILYRLGHYQSALADADNALKSRPTSHKAFYHRALSLSKLGRAEESIFSHCSSICLDRHSIGVSNGIRLEITKLLQSLISPITSDQTTLPSIFSSPYSMIHSRKRRHHHILSVRKHKTKKHILSFSSNNYDEDNSSCGEEDYFQSQYYDDDIAEICDMKKRRKSLTAYNLNILNHQHLQQPHNIIPKINFRLRTFVDQLNKELERVIKKKNNLPQLKVNPISIEQSDFDCVLCCRTLWRPVVTPCGHTYCWVCLDRCMDYSSSCPLCMAPLIEQFRHHLHNGNSMSMFNSSTLISLKKRQVTRFVEEAMKRFIPGAYMKRQQQEMDREPTVPVFICTTAFPSVPCPLFVYEPRYRLMVRRAIESGERQFGIALPQQNGRQRYVEYGTMLDIRDCVQLGDGCSILSTVGGRRFKVIARHEKDGYDTANVEFIQDDKLLNEDAAVDDEKMHLIKDLHENVLLKAIGWHQSLPESIKHEIFKSFGKMPDLEEDWENVADGPAWAWWIIAILPLSQQLKAGILATTSLEKRLRAIDKTLNLEYMAAQQKQKRSLCVVSTSSCCEGLSSTQQCQAIDCCLRERTTSNHHNHHPHHHNHDRDRQNTNHHLNQPTDDYLL